MKAIFRVDASVTLGIGHVMRCLTLADELNNNDFSITFISRSLPRYLKDFILSKGYELKILAKPGLLPRIFHRNINSHPLSRVSKVVDAQETIQAITSANPDWLIVDHYDLDAYWHNQLKPYVKHILVIDDLADRQLDCSIVLDQTYGRQANDYVPLVNKDCRFLLGARYALLRPEFQNLRIQALHKRKHTAGIQRILVSVGGTDPRNLTLPILDALLHITWPVKPSVNVILGSMSPFLNEVREQIKNSPLETTLQIDVSNMSVPMLQADLAIGAAGTTTWERCCLGLPTIMFITAENQKNVAQQLKALGAVKIIKLNQNFQKTTIVKPIEQLLDSMEDYQTMADRSFLIADGLGTKRVLLEMDSIKTRLGIPICLRPVTAHHETLLYKWQCTPATRRYAHNPEIPSITEHRLWLSKKLLEPNSICDIIYYGSIPAGIICLDPVESEHTPTYLISIIIDPEYYQLGIGKATLKIITRLIPNAIFKAEVLKDNLSSQSLFNSAGFDKLGEELFLKLPSE